MKELHELTSMKTIETFLNENKLAFLYISQPNCSVCHGLLPQIQQVLEQYPEIKMGHINASEVTEVAGRFSVFTVPVLLLFVNNKEYLREARIVHIEPFNKKIKKIYDLITS